MSHTQIMKVQLPLSTNLPEPLCLIYNEDKSIYEQFPIPDQLKGLMGTRMKAFMYFSVETTKATTHLTLTGEAPWQEW